MKLIFKDTDGSITSSEANSNSMDIQPGQQLFLTGVEEGSQDIQVQEDGTVIITVTDRETGEPITLTLPDFQNTLAGNDPSDPFSLDSALGISTTSEGDKEIEEIVNDPSLEAGEIIDNLKEALAESSEAGPDGKDGTVIDSFNSLINNLSSSFGFEEQAPIIQGSNYNPEILERARLEKEAKEKEEDEKEAKEERDSRGGSSVQDAEDSLREVEVERIADETGYNDQKKNDPVSNNGGEIDLTEKEETHGSEDEEELINTLPEDEEIQDDKNIDEETLEEETIKKETIDELNELDEVNQDDETSDENTNGGEDAKSDTDKDSSQDVQESSNEEDKEEDSTSSDGQPKSETDEQVQDNEENENADDTEETEEETEPLPQDDDTEENVDDSNTTVTITPINLAPEIIEDNKVILELNEDNNITFNESEILNNITDADGDIVAIGNVTSNVGNITLENGIYTVEVPENYNGTIELSYTATDGNYEVPGKSLISVIPVNDIPECTFLNTSTLEDTPVILDYDLYDVDGDPMTVTIFGAPANGTAVINENNELVFTPIKDYNGSTEITIKITDGNGGIIYETAEIIVTPVNDEPEINIVDSIVIDEDSEGIITFDITDIDGDNTSFTVKEPNHGIVIVDGTTITYIPDENYNGSDALTINYTDGIVQKASTVNIDIQSVNDLPYIEIVNEVQMIEDQVQEILMTAGDIEGTVSVIVEADNGHAIVQDGNIIYTPNPDFNGVDTISISVTDEDGVTVLKNVNIQIDNDNTDITFEIKTETIYETHTEIVEHTETRDVEVEKTRTIEVIDEEANTAAGITQDSDGNWSTTEQETEVYNEVVTEEKTREIEEEYRTDILDTQAMEDAGYTYLDPMGWMNETTELDTAVNTSDIDMLALTGTKLMFGVVGGPISTGEVDISHKVDNISIVIDDYSIRKDNGTIKLFNNGVEVKELNLDNLYREQGLPENELVHLNINQGVVFDSYEVIKPTYTQGWATFSKGPFKVGGIIEEQENVISGSTTAEEVPEQDYIYEMGTRTITETYEEDVTYERERLIDVEVQADPLMKNEEETYTETEQEEYIVQEEVQVQTHFHQDILDLTDSEYNIDLSDLVLEFEGNDEVQKINLDDNILSGVTLDELLTLADEDLIFEGKEGSKIDFSDLPENETITKTGEVQKGEESYDTFTYHNDMGLEMDLLINQNIQTDF